MALRCCRIGHWLQAEGPRLVERPPPGEPQVSNEQAGRLQSLAQLARVHLLRAQVHLLRSRVLAQGQPRWVQGQVHCAPLADPDAAVHPLRCCVAALTASLSRRWDWRVVDCPELSRAGHVQTASLPCGPAPHQLLLRSAAWQCALHEWARPHPARALATSLLPMAAGEVGGTRVATVRWFELEWRR